MTIASGYHTFYSLSLKMQKQMNICLYPESADLCRLKSTVTSTESNALVMRLLLFGTITDSTLATYFQATAVTIHNYLFRNFL